VLLARSLHVVTEYSTDREHLAIGVIAAARIRQEKDPRSAQLPGGRSKMKWAFLLFPGGKEHSKDRDTQEDHDVRLIAFNFLLQVHDTLPILDGVEEHQSSLYSDL